MTDTDRCIEDIVTAFLGNAFEISPSCRRTGLSGLHALDAGAAIARLLADGQIERAKLLILAVGHARACQEGQSKEQADGYGDGHLGEQAASPQGKGKKRSRRPPAAAASAGTVSKQAKSTRDDKDARAVFLFNADMVPTSALRRLPRPSADYVRIIDAAGRCYRALTKIYGRSSSLHEVRRDTWAACFGKSLRHAIDLESVIRDQDVLILGETGTGKEAFARAIQVATPGPRGGGAAPSAAINAAAVPDALVESELFGHIKGAFTGASEHRIGRLRSADGGSFFLDEVGDLPLTTQVKLLRVIETNDVYPVGSDTPHRVDVRYVAATHKELQKLVVEGHFRGDLFERLAGNILYIPPLRERAEDIIEIALPFVQRVLNPQHYGAQIEDIDRFLRSDTAQHYHWPGNVRELQNVLRNLILGVAPGLKGQKSRVTNQASADATIPEYITAATANLRQVQDWYVKRVLGQCRGNLSQASRVLGIDRSTLRRNLERK